MKSNLFCLHFFKDFERDFKSCKTNKTGETGDQETW